MRQLISLVVLVFCSLIAFDISYATAQTWRLTNDSYSDSLPRIIIDNQDQIWVEWLSNAQGNYDVCYQRYNAGWSSREWLTNDDVDQKSCDLTCNKVTGSVWTAWDSAGKIQYAVFLSSWYGPYTAIDSIFTFTQYGLSGRISIMAGDSGTKFLSWTADDTTGCCSVYIMRYDSGAWGQPECIRQGSGYGIISYTNYSSYGLSLNIYQQPATISFMDSYSMGGFSWLSVDALGWIPDTGWVYLSIAGWDNHTQPYSLMPCPFDIGFSENGDLHVISAYADSNNVMSLMDNKFVTSDFIVDTTYIIKSQIHPQNAAITNLAKSSIAWSDSHSIFLNTFYDSMWSQSPVQISDTSLHNCINPDIVAENDSTVWVCYQSGGDIYVTKTSVPLGVSGKPEIINKPASFAVKTWPNPAQNKFNIQCNGIENKKAKAKIYNITGQLVKNIDIKGNQTVWNCTDQNGKKVSAGIYILNVISGNESKIQKISIIR
jgi:hypothetical protein